MEKQEQQKTPLQRVLHKYEERVCGKWKPNGLFYHRVEINQKRFGMLLRGELELKASEAKRLSDFFGVDIYELLS
jgi:hypothetical protein